MENQKFLGNKYKNKTFAEVFTEMKEKNDWKYLKYIEKQVNDGKKDQALLNNLQSFIEYYNSKIDNELVKVSVIENNNRTIKYCYHISDTHIRLSQRYDEYQHVFDKLYECLRKEEDGIIVITGDLLHSKCELSGNCTLFTLKFLKTLASIFPTFLILGNHDMNLENLDDVDSITAIIEGRDIPNLYYLRESGIYEYNNLAFGVCSRIDNKNIDAKQILSDKIKIALYHGCVAECKNDVGYRLKKNKLLEDFDGYDYVMLGDVHTFQHIRPHIAYASSLIMQNFAETGPHGYLKWFLEEKKTEYIDIENDFMHLNLEMKENKVFYKGIYYTPAEFSEVCNLPPYGYFCLKPCDCDYGVIKEVKDIITHRTVKPSFLTKPNLLSTHDENQTITSFSHKDMLPMLLNYIDKQKDAKVDLEEVKKILLSIDLTNVSAKKEKSSHEWRMLSLKFDNMFVFGENNTIDFEKIPKNDVTGIYGNNSFGKTSVVDVLCQTLFDSPARNSAKDDIINKQRDSFRTEFTFEIGKDIYTFKKWGKRKKNGKVDKHESLYINTTNLSGVDRLKTDITLKELIGDKSTFLANAVCQQFSDVPFWELTEIKQKETLMGLINFDVFVYIKEVVKTNFDEIKKQNSNLKSKIEDANKFSYSTKILEHNKELKNLTQQISGEESNYNTIEAAINENFKKFKSTEKYSELKNNEIEMKLKNYRDEEKQMLSFQVELDTLKQESFDCQYDECKIRKEYDIVMEKIIHLSANLHQLPKNIKKIPTLTPAQYTEIKQTYAFYKHENNKIPQLDKELEDLYEGKNSLTRQLKPTTIQNIKDTKILKLLEENLKEQELRFDKHNKNITTFSPETYDKYMETKKLLETHEKDVKRCYEIRDKLSQYEYNPNCSYCLKNQFIVDAKKTIKNIPTLEKTILQCKEEYDTFLPILNLKILHDESRLLLPHVEKEIEQTKRKIEGVVNKIHNNEIELQIEKIGKEISSIQEKKTKIHTSFINVQKELENIEDNNKLIENDKILEQIALLKNSKEYINYEIYNKEKASLEKRKNRIEELELKLNKKHDIEHKIYTLNKELDSIKLDLENQKHNIEIQKIIDILNIKKKNSFANLKELNIRLTEINTQLVIYEENLTELQENEAKQCTTQHLENVYSFITSTLSREGVKLHLLEHYLPQISSTVNRIVSEFIEREIKLFIEDGQLVFQSIKSFAKDNDHHVKVHGGMETFILDLAFKIAFSQFSESPKCNMLIIDERLSVLDKEHRDNIEDILNFLRTNYSYTFIIAHEQKLKDSTTSNIYITQDENKISTIKQL